MILVLNGQHLRVQDTYGWGRRLLLLDLARGRERLMEIQQDDGVVVEVAAISTGLRQALREGEVLRREREAPGAWGAQPSLPPLYIGPLGGRRP